MACQASLSVMCFAPNSVSSVVITKPLLPLQSLLGLLCLLGLLGLLRLLALSRCSHLLSLLRYSDRLLQAQEAPHGCGP